MISTHPARLVLEKTASERGISIFEGKVAHILLKKHSLIRWSTVLEAELERLRKEMGVATLTELTRDLHFYPDIHGLKILSHFTK